MSRSKREPARRVVLARSRPSLVVWVAAVVTWFALGACRGVVDQDSAAATPRRAAEQHSSPADVATNPAPERSRATAQPSAAEPGTDKPATQPQQPATSEASAPRVDAPASFDASAAQLTGAPMSPESPSAEVFAPAVVPDGPPPIPIRFSVVGRSESEIEVSWQPARLPVPAGYEVFRGDRLIGRVAEPGFVESGLRLGERRCYSVRAVDAKERRSPRTPPRCGETPDLTPPEIPTEVIVTTEPGNAVSVNWRPSKDNVGVVAYEVVRETDLVATVQETRFREKGLTTLRRYCYTVRAADRAGNRSRYAAPSCAVIPDTTPPSVPARLVAKARGEHEVALTWEASTDDAGVTRYEVLRTGKAEPMLVTSTAARDEGLAVAQPYCYSVRACDAADNCSAHSPEACVTTPDLTPPTPPASLASAAPNDNEIVVSWAAATDNVGVTGYYVYRGDERVAQVGAETTFKDSELEPLKTYCYAVRAHDAAGNVSGHSANTCATTPDLTPPTVPARPAALPVSKSQVFIAWDPSEDNVGVVGYELFRGEQLVTRLTATRFRDTALEPDHQYCYTIKAADAAGNRSAAAGPVCARTISTGQVAAPSDLRVRRLSPTNVLLEWEPSEDPGVVYAIYASGNKVQGYTRYDSFNPSGAILAAPNCFRVAAIDISGRESPKSNEVCAIVVADGTRLSSGG